MVFFTYLFWAYYWIKTLLLYMGGLLRFEVLVFIDWRWAQGILVLLRHERAFVPVELEKCCLWSWYLFLLYLFGAYHFKQIFRFYSFYFLFFKIWVGLRIRNLPRALRLNSISVAAATWLFNFPFYFWILVILIRFQSFLNRSWLHTFETPLAILRRENWPFAHISQLRWGQLDLLLLFPQQVKDNLLL